MDQVNRLRSLCGIGLFSMLLFFTHYSNAASASSPTLSILIEQARDVDCDAFIESDFTVEPFSSEPGGCVRYRLTVTNAGVDIAHKVTIKSATPDFSVFHPGAICSVSNCMVQTPPAGSAGDLIVELDAMSPGESIDFLYSVKIE